MAPDANDGKPYSATYLRTLNNQLTAILNHAERYYGLSPNPAMRTVKMGGKEARTMNFWTKDEYLRFSDAMMDDPRAFVIFEVLYWTGIREGKLLALTPDSFDWKKSTMRIDKSYQRLGGRDVITDPKTPKSVRTVKLSRFLADEVRDYANHHPEIGEGDRLFPVSKHYISHAMQRGCAASGVKKIRVHDLRHSHVSLLINMGFTALAIADRHGARGDRHHLPLRPPVPECARRHGQRARRRARWILMPCPNSHRKRTISKAFRCSPEERHRIELLAKAAGVTQQEYIMAKIEDKEFTIVPDIRTFKMLRDEMRAVAGELSRLRNTGRI